MRYIIGTIAVLSLLAGTAQAQIIVEPRHSSTAAEGWWRGTGAYLRGLGRYLEGRGVYENYHEDARRKRIDNWSHGVRTRWDIKDQYKQRQNRLDWPTRRMKQLDMLEKVHAVKQREADLREKGILPPKRPRGFTYKGVTYPDYSAFKESDTYKVLMAERAKREAERRLEKAKEEARQQEALAFLRKWNKMSFLERERYKQKRRLDQLLKEKPPVVIDLRAPSRR